MRRRKRRPEAEPLKEDEQTRCQGLPFVPPTCVLERSCPTGKGTHQLMRSILQGGVARSPCGDFIFFLFFCPAATAQRKQLRKRRPRPGRRDSPSRHPRENLCSSEVRDLAVKDCRFSSEPSPTNASSAPTTTRGPLRRGGSRAHECATQRRQDERPAKAAERSL